MTEYQTDANLFHIGIIYEWAPHLQPKQLNSAIHVTKTRHLIGYYPLIVKISLDLNNLNMSPEQ